ncbi:MAG TPA: hypothetical protein VL172_11835, partial [Kofleriaceae bacterium]|nr:hypothetical protein [Kofleriaceae bacterium]
DVATQRSGLGGAGKLIKSVTRLAVSSAGVPAVAAEAARYFGKLWVTSTRHADPYGQLLVDGQPVINLPKQSDTLSPGWGNAWSPATAAGPDQVIELQLRDFDLAGKSDTIGNCTWQLPADLTGTAIVESRSCTGDLLAAYVIAQPVEAAAAAAIVPGSYRIRRVSVEVTSTKGNGRRWDTGFNPGSLPDPRISVTVNGQVIYTCDKNQDQLQAVCNPGKVIDIDEATTLGLAVDDVDTLANDGIGTARISRLTTRKTGRALELTTAGQLNRATIELEPAE